MQIKEKSVLAGSTSLERIPAVPSPSHKKVYKSDENHKSAKVSMSPKEPSRTKSSNSFSPKIERKLSYQDKLVLPNKTSGNKISDAKKLEGQKAGMSIKDYNDAVDLLEKIHAGRKKIYKNEMDPAVAARLTKEKTEQEEKDYDYRMFRAPRGGLVIDSSDDED